MNIPVQSPMQLSAHLKSLRKAKKLTQAQLGARIGVKQTRMADIEKNPAVISVDQLMQLLHALDARLLIAPPGVRYPPLESAPPLMVSEKKPADW